MSKGQNGKEEDKLFSSNSDLVIPSSHSAQRVVDTALTPAAQEFGDEFKEAGRELAKIAKTGVKTVSVLMSPLSGIVWGYEKISEWVTNDVEQKLKTVPLNQRVSPDPQVAGPALEALKYAGNKIELRDAFANLLANSMDTTTADNCHPAFVEILKQITPDEAKILKTFKAPTEKFPILEVRLHDGPNRNGNYHITFSSFTDIGFKAGCLHPETIDSSIDNLCRLEICRIPVGLSVGNSNKEYEALENHAIILEHVNSAKAARKSISFDRRGLGLTAFGQLFWALCIDDKDSKPTTRK